MLFVHWIIFYSKLKWYFAFELVEMQNDPPPFFKTKSYTYFVSQNQSDQYLSIFLKLYTQLEDTLNYPQKDVHFFSNPWKRIPSFQYICEILIIF